MKVTSPDSERYFEGIRPEWAGIQFFIAWSSLYKEACVVSFEICPKRNIGNILDKNIDNLT